MFATILEKSIGTIRFRVDDVIPAAKKLRVSNTKLDLEERTGQKLLAFSHADTFETVSPREIHPLAWAVHLAFAQHRPLCLTPDILWIAIAQGFAQHVNNNAEQLSDQFVHHQGKEKLVVETSELSKPEHWAEAVQQWGLQIRDRVGGEVYRLIECNFTTTTPITQTVSRIVMMDTFKQYFDYECALVCGIPEVIFAGTVEDWQEIYHRVLLLAKYDFHWWVGRLMPICQEWIKTAEGRPSLEFWQAIYMPQETYGSNLITGWLGDLFPYLKEGMTESITRKNPLLEKERYKFIVEDAISLESLPGGLCQVPVLLKASQTQMSLQLLGGFIGIVQEPIDGVLQPELGWAVQELSGDFILSELLKRLQHEQTTFTPIDWSQASLDFESIPKEIVQMLEQFDGARFYVDDGIARWSLRKFNQYKSCLLEGRYSQQAKVFIDLVDGRSLAYFKEDDVWWVLLCPPFAEDTLLAETNFGQQGTNQSSIEAADCVIVAKGLVQFFARMLEADGCYYFDDPDFVADEKPEFFQNVLRNPN